MRIAVDGMGGDHAPGVVVDGAVLAARELPVEVVVVGDESRLREELARHHAVPATLMLHHASEVIGMDEPPALSVRKKRDSSLNVMVELAKTRGVDAILSAGNTGAMVCASTLGLRLLEGIERPGIAIVLPTLTGNTLLIDVGATIDPKPEHLVQFAVMGSVYARAVLGKPSPRVGLLNVGEEESKGTEFVKEAFRLLEHTPLHFVGNAEGRDLFTGRCDVIVCDGFVGNITLKVTESMAKVVAQLLKRELRRNALTQMGAFLSLSAFKALRRKMDYAEYGGAPLLGVDGTAIICHGASSARAIKNGIRVAASSVTEHVNGAIVAAMREVSCPKP
ncbi:MAG: phosphate acyltransferase [Omnitrophica WOR_2 bacterium RIFCSPHIGHO2_02_FULL_68_15]|nr:MAG: phosphate acyltransferase [Omnitrophica WOR_2 bacterium RIFCSPHIGHO2_02_FULL_68_15]